MGYICATGVHGVMEAHADPEFRQILNRCIYQCPGRNAHGPGLAVFWAFETWIGYLARTSCWRCADCRSSEAIVIFSTAANRAWPSCSARTLQKRFPGLQVVGTYTPPFEA